MVLVMGGWCKVRMITRGGGWERSLPATVVDEEGSVFLEGEAVGHPEAHEGVAEPGVVGFKDVGQALFADSAHVVVFGLIEFFALAVPALGSGHRLPMRSPRQILTFRDQPPILGLLDVQKSPVNVVVTRTGFTRCRSRAVLAFRYLRSYIIGIGTQVSIDMRCQRKFEILGYMYSPLGAPSEIYKQYRRRLIR